MGKLFEKEITDKEMPYDDFIELIESSIEQHGILGALRELELSVESTLISDNGAFSDTDYDLFALSIESLSKTYDVDLSDVPGDKESYSDANIKALTMLDTKDELVKHRNIIEGSLESMLTDLRDGIKSVFVYLTTSHKDLLKKANVLEEKIKANTNEWQPVNNAYIQRQFGPKGDVVTTLNNGVSTIEKILPKIVKEANRLESINKTTRNTDKTDVAKSDLLKNETGKKVMPGGFTVDIVDGKYMAIDTDVPKVMPALTIKGALKIIETVKKTSDTMKRSKAISVAIHSVAAAIPVLPHEVNTVYGYKRNTVAMSNIRFVVKMMLRRTVAASEAALQYVELSMDGKEVSKEDIDMKTTFGF